MESAGSSPTIETRQSQDPTFGLNLDNSQNTEELLSSPMVVACQTLGKRVRADESETSVAPRLQKLKLNHEYHDPNYWNFVPKYISDRIPLPFEILGNIVNKYLDLVDRKIITGECIFVENPNCVNLNRVEIIRKMPDHSWQFIMYSFWKTDPNDPVKI